MVEGYIAPVSGTTYEGSLSLSEKRAENVRDYCLSDNTGLDTSKLASTMETVGYSQSKPVYDSDGNVISGTGLAESILGYEFAYYIGYFLPSIIGIILIILGIKERYK